MFDFQQTCFSMHVHCWVLTGQANIKIVPHTCTYKHSHTKLLSFIICCFKEPCCLIFWTLLLEQVMLSNHTLENLNPSKSLSLVFYYS